jgi:hypothetical protein
MFSKLVLLIAFAATTDAFKSTALRSLHFQAKKSSGLSKHRDFIDFRQRKNPPSFTKTLRAAGTLEDLDVAQVRIRKTDTFIFIPKQETIGIDGNIDIHNSQENFKTWNDEEYKVAQARIFFYNYRILLLA